MLSSPRVLMGTQPFREPMQTIYGSTQEGPRRLKPQAWKRKQIWNKIVLKHWWTLDCRANGSWPKKNLKSSQLCPAEQQHRWLCIDKKPISLLGWHAMEQHSNKCTSARRQYNRVKFKHLLLEVSTITCMPPKLLHLGALAVDRWWPWWLKAAHGLTSSNMVQGAQKGWSGFQSKVHGVPQISESPIQSPSSFIH